MIRSLLLASAALVALAASPAMANKFIVPDNGALPFAERFEMSRTAALHEPTFNTRRECSLAHECATVEFAVVKEGRLGDVGEFFIYPDKSPQDVIMCSTYTLDSDLSKHPDIRGCSKAGTETGTTAFWYEAFFPGAGEFREIPYGEGFTDPDCKSLQQLEYDIDPAYADCVVRKLDIAAPAPPTPAAAPATGESIPSNFPRGLLTMDQALRIGATAPRRAPVPAACANIASQTFPSIAALRHAHAVCDRRS
jgi:hypothetical protein